MIYQKALEGISQSSPVDIGHLYRELTQLEKQFVIQEEAVLEALGGQGYLLDNRELVEKLVAAGELSGQRI
jgi:hypothetical protein